MNKSILNHNILNNSLELGIKYMLNAQKEAGNFVYEYDFITGESPEGDSEVRQAGALWGLALIYSYKPTNETKEAIIKGLAFFDKYSKKTDDGRNFIIYSNEEESKTGTVALIILALVDFLRSENDLKSYEKYKQDLYSYLMFLLSLRKENGQFYSAYDINGNGYGLPSPYFDGEALLALIKAVKYSKFLNSLANLNQIIFESAEEMHKQNVEIALKKHPDSPVTKGFYQWGSMAYYGSTDNFVKFS